MGLRGRLVIAGAIALLVASALIGWGASQQAHYKRQAENQAAENARHTDYDIRYRCVPLPSLAERNCAIDRRREQRDYERHEQDLYAQKTAAFWTFLMGAAAIVGMLLSAVGVFLVFFTFGETRRANILNMRENARATRRAVTSASETAAALAAADRSAVAAAEQVSISRDTAYRQLRAYISFEDVEIDYISKEHIKGRIVIRNAGKTPAAVKLFIASWVDSHPRLNLPPEAPQPTSWEFHGPFVNANSRTSVDWFYPTATLATEEEGKLGIARLIANPTRVVLYFYGRVEFTDYLRRERTLHFCFRNNGQIEIGTTCDMVPLPFGNGYEDRSKEAEHGSAPL